ncbi:MAG: hypothetical protein L6R38_006867 [Xanthoria sp. 2 TBL-2021]|nr:MAG: hypothetical protein L6R38_006867 [Xanthoria sp. 2 TBL-2021]
MDGKAIDSSADVFYFGPDPTNTACLSAITSSPPLPTPPPISISDEVCEQAAVIDPPIRAVRVDRIAGPKDGVDIIA